MRLGLREANQQFSKAIRAVRAGKEVVLTDRGHPIAIIKPMSSGDGRDAALQAMANEGLIRTACPEGSHARASLAAGQGAGHAAVAHYQ